ncbi:MAG: hypothetical protein V4792_09790 [Pseudomonadota bacterium]
MTDEQSAILDDLLSRWHHWQGAESAKGYAPQSAGFGQYRASRQYDDTNGALDSDLDARRCAQVDHEAQQMHDPHRAAIYCEARNLGTGRAVWSSPRLPADQGERNQVVIEARIIMSRRLIASGVI